MFSFHFRGMRVVLKGVKTSTDFRSYRAFSLTWLATIQIYWNKRKFLHRKKVGSTPTGLVWDTNMAAVSLFRDTNMAAVTSGENSLLNTGNMQWRLQLRYSQG